MALHTLALNPAAAPPEHLLERHFTRKHGPGRLLRQSLTAPSRVLPETGAGRSAPAVRR